MITGSGKKTSRIKRLRYVSYGGDTMVEGDSGKHVIFSIQNDVE